MSYRFYTEWLKNSLTLEGHACRRVSSDFCAMLYYSLYLSRDEDSVKYYLVMKKAYVTMICRSVGTSVVTLNLVEIQAHVR